MIDNNIKEDKIRKADIINATGHEILHVNVKEEESFESINAQINEIVRKIKDSRNEDEFIAWNIDAEYNSKTLYLTRLY